MEVYTIYQEGWFSSCHQKSIFVTNLYRSVRFELFPLLPIILLFHSPLQQKITPYVLGSSVYIEKIVLLSQGHCLPYSCIINLCSYDYPSLEEESMSPAVFSKLPVLCSLWERFYGCGGRKAKVPEKTKKNLPTTRDSRPTCIAFMFFGCLLAGRYLKNFLNPNLFFPLGHSPLSLTVRV